MPRVTSASVLLIVAANIRSTLHFCNLSGVSLLYAYRLDSIHSSIMNNYCYAVLNYLNVLG